MMFLVEFFQAVPGDMRVDLRGGDIGMAEHHLNHPEIRAAFQQMTGKGVTQHMRRNRLSNACPLRITPEPEEKTLTGHRAPLLAQKERGAFPAFQQLRPSE